MTRKQIAQSFSDKTLNLQKLYVEALEGELFSLIREIIELGDTAILYKKRNKKGKTAIPAHLKGEIDHVVSLIKYTKQVLDLLGRKN